MRSTSAALASCTVPTVIPRSVGEVTALAYDAAKVGRRTDGWVANGGSANVEIAPALSRVRNRCRDVVRNN